MTMLMTLAFIPREGYRAWVLYEAYYVLACSAGVVWIRVAACFEDMAAEECSACCPTHRQSTSGDGEEIV